MKVPKRISLVLSTRAKGLGRKWIYFPGAMLVLLGLSILLYPQAIHWILAGFFMGSGALMIHVTRVLKRTFEALQQRLSDLYMEQMVEEEMHDSVENPDHSLSWVN